MLIIMIGKGCTDSSINKMQKQKKSAETVSQENDVKINISTSAPETAPPVSTDMFGRPLAAVQTMTAAAETVPAETDVFGNIVTTTEIFLTDVFGNTVTTVTGTENIQTDIFGSTVTTIQTDMTDFSGSTVTTQTVTADENPVETTTLSPLEQYNEDLKNPDFMSGFNHGEYEVDKEGNTKSTLPPDFVIIVE